MSTKALIRIPEAAPVEIVHFKRGSTKDIIKIVMHVVNKDDLTNQVYDYAQYFRGDNDEDQYRKLKQLWKWVRKNIKYVADGEEIQVIQHPARLAQSSKGDCKSFSVFVHFVLKALCIKNKIRFVSQNSKRRIDHVYNVAYIGNREVIIDTVYKIFDEEPPFVNRKVDYNPKSLCPIPQTAAVAGIKGTKVNWLGIGLIGLAVYGLTR